MDSRKTWWASWIGSRGRLVAMPSRYGKLSAKVKTPGFQTDPLPTRAAGPGRARNHSCPRTEPRPATSMPSARRNAATRAIDRRLFIRVARLVLQKRIQFAGRRRQPRQIVRDPAKELSAIEGLGRFQLFRAQSLENEGVDRITGNRRHCRAHDFLKRPVSSPRADECVLLRAGPKDSSAAAISAHFIERLAACPKIHSRSRFPHTRASGVTS